MCRSSNKANQHSELMLDSPATAWSEFCREPISTTQVTCLRRRNLGNDLQSAVFLLEESRPLVRTIVAKHCRRQDAEIERLMYERVLPRLSAPTIEYYGFQESRRPGFGWLFMAYAGGTPYSPLCAKHRKLAGEWLGRLHIEALSAAEDVPLPERFPEPFLEYVAENYQIIENLLDTSNLRDGDRRALTILAEQLTYLATHWLEVERIQSLVPQVVIHGDFLPSNMSIHPREGLLPFDWALCGRGRPGMDLAQSPVPSKGFSGNPDISVYWSVVRTHWCTLRFEDLSRVAECATVCQCLAALGQEAPFLKGEWPERTFNNMDYYAVTLRRCFNALEWDC